MTDFNPATANQADGSSIYHVFRSADGFRLVVEREDAAEATAVASVLFTNAGKSGEVELIASHDTNAWDGSTPEDSDSFEDLGITESMALEAAFQEFDDDDHSVYPDDVVSGFWVGGFWLQPSIALDQLASMEPVAETRQTPDAHEARRQLKALLDVLAKETTLSQDAKLAIERAAPFADA